MCELRAALPQDHAAAMQGLRRFEGKLASLATACPRVLGGPVSLVRMRGGWHASSFASQEFRLEFDDAGPVQLQLLRPPYTTRTLATFTGEGVVLKAPCDASISRP